MQVHEFNVVQTAACLVLGHLSHIHMGANEFQESGLIVKIVRVMRRFYHCQYMTFVFSPSFVCTPVNTHMYVNCTHTCMHACMHICTYIYAANAKCTHILFMHKHALMHHMYTYTCIQTIYMLYATYLRAHFDAAHALIHASYLQMQACAVLIFSPFLSLSVCMCVCTVSLSLYYLRSLSFSLSL